MQPIRFCAHQGCPEVAIKTARSVDLCRAHYRSEVLAAVELVEAEVVASMGKRGEQAGVTDAVTNQTVHSGTVRLDPLETRAAALVYGGIIRLKPGPAAEAAKAEG
jgi:hypothetical protein